MRGSSLLFRLDPGWLFVTAGLVLCAAGILIPAQQSVEDLHAQLARLEQQHTLNRDRLQAHQTFLERLRHRDPSLMRRLAAAQLNLVRAGTTPVLIASTRQATVTDWIVHSVEVARAPAPRLPEGHPRRSWLSSLTAGSGRLWVIGAGVLVVFVGLLIDGRPAGAGRTRDPAAVPRRSQPKRPDVTSGVEWSGNGAEDEDDEWEEDENEDLDEEEDDDEEELDEDEEEGDEEEEEGDEEELDEDEEEGDEEEEEGDEEEELDDDEEEDDEDEDEWDDEDDDEEEQESGDNKEP